MTRVKIVILNWNGRDYLERFLPSLVSRTPGAGIVVADNGSTDDSVRFLERSYPQVELLRLDRNLRLCGGIQPGARRAERRVFRTAQFRCRSDRGVARSVGPHARRRRVGRRRVSENPLVRRAGQVRVCRCGRRVHRFFGLSFLSRPHTRFDRVRQGTVRRSA